MLTCILLLLLSAAPLAAQVAPAAWTDRLFVADADDARALWVNPAGLAARRAPGSAALALYDDGGRSQLLAALRLGGLALGYQHDAFRERPVFPGPYFESGDAYLLGGAVSAGHLHLGYAATHHRVGDPETSWDAGLLWRPARALSFGAAWRAIGSPVVRGRELPSRVVVGAGVRPAAERLTLLAEAAWDADDGALAEWGVGARATLFDGLEAALTAREPRRSGDTRFVLALSAVLPRADVTVSARAPGLRGPEAGTFELLLRGGVREDALRIGRGVRTLTLAGDYADFEPAGFALLGGGAPAAQPLIRAILEAADDPGTAALLLRVRGVGGGFVGGVSAIHQEIRTAVTRFREAGKPVVAYLEGGGGAAEFYIASAADRIVLPPLGTVQGLGVNLEILRLGGFFDEQLHVDWDIITAGQYKTMFQQLTDSATAAQRAALQSLVDVAYDELVEALAGGRRLSPDSARALAQGGLHGARWAREAGLVDTLGWWEDARAIAQELADAKIRGALRLEPRWQTRWGPVPQIAIVYASGPITAGESTRDPLFGAQVIGGRTVARMIEAAGKDDEVAAVVFRIDSPGGSPLGSELIRRALEEVRTERKKPVVVSMGEVAASGGYWVSTSADAVVADPLTVTGSIGVIAALPEASRLLDSLDITAERYRRGRNTGLFSPFEERDADELAQLAGWNAEIYEMFIERVAEGRALPADSVREIAQGRVWLGEQAAGIGLVDVLGGLADAERIAAERAGLRPGDYRVVLRRRPRKGLLEAVFRVDGATLRRRLAARLLGW